MIYEDRMGMKEHIRILEMAAEGKLPETIDNSSSLSVNVVKELIDAGYLKAIDASSFDGVAYIKPCITSAGRQYLNECTAEEQRMDEKKQNERELKGVSDITKLNDTWKDIEREYDVSKRRFGRTINFVDDEFKRKIIFRDIEQAFILAQQGFNKPAVVLAGSIIEELIRLYLIRKNIRPRGNSLDAYIQACQENGLLKGAIHKLVDSVRQFRNIVHLEKEISSRASISKPTAKGAVASIFTIANDFEIDS